MWENMGNTTFLSLEKWPNYDDAKTVENSIEIAVQINGKLRATIVVPKDITKDDAIATAKADNKVAEAIKDKTVIKEIFVPGKIVNIVVK
jgi:leucyl-tRNA synthetase